MAFPQRLDPYPWRCFACSPLRSRPLLDARGRRRSSPADHHGYHLGPKDLVEIKVFEVPELNIEVRVTEDGMVNLPLVGDVPAAD